MREIAVERISEAVAAMCVEAGSAIGDDVLRGLEDARAAEESTLGRHALDVLLDNARIARDEAVPYCQDCGVSVVFVDLGQDVRIVGGGLSEAIHEGVRRGYREGYLRSSMVRGPFDRVNTGDNTPAMIHYDIEPGDTLRIRITLKGGGCENMSRQAMLRPADGVEGVKRFVVETVAKAGPNACPPLIPGVGIGGGFDVSTALAKRALFRKVGEYHPDPVIAALERELFDLCNDTGVGPQGLGGRRTVLWVPIETAACHITGLPVAVNIQCHAQRWREAIL